MSMSIGVYGIKPPDEKWQKMKAVWDACETAKVCPPTEVTRFFDGERPDEKGVVVSLRGNRSTTEYKADMENGFEVDVTKLPEGVKIIRFVNSY